MSRWVEWGSNLWPRFFFEPPLELPQGTCPQCGGLGVVPEQIDQERLDVAVPCCQCQTFCAVCRRWVKRKGHTHESHARKVQL